VPAFGFDDVAGSLNHEVHAAGNTMHFTDANPETIGLWIIMALYPNLFRYAEAQMSSPILIYGGDLRL
jgi:hypothetical protein